MNQFDEKPIVVYGPSGCGKTRSGTRLAKAFGKKEVVELEGYEDSRKLAKHQLGLSNQPGGFEVTSIHYSKAMMIIKKIKKAQKRAQLEVLSEVKP